MGAPKEAIPCSATSALQTETAVSLIQSICHDFGSAVIGGDTGIILQNRQSRVTRLRNTDRLSVS